MHAWKKWLLALVLCVPIAASCGEETSPEDGDDAREVEPVTGNKKDAGKGSQPSQSTDAGAGKDAGKTSSQPPQTGPNTKDAGKGTAPKSDAGKMSTPVDAGKLKDAGKDKDAGAPVPTQPATPTGPKPTDTTTIGAIADDWREPTCVEIARAMRGVIASGGILDCLGQAIHAAKMAGDAAGCDPAREICNGNVDPVGVQESCEGTQLLVCEEATLGSVRTCLADMKKSLDSKNQKLSCASSEDDFLATALPLPASCEGVGMSCPALSGLVHFFD